METFNKTSQPLVTVCISTYNALAYIFETIDSVLSQTFQDFELLIVDDGSTDDTCALIASYGDSRIRLIRNRHNYIETQNLCLSESSGKYIARLDHDDRMVKDRLRIQLDYMESHPEVDLLSGGASLFGEYSECRVPRIVHRKLTMYDLEHENPVIHPAAMFRRSTVCRYNLRYEEGYTYADDYRLWFHMLDLGLHLECLPDILIEYRVSHRQASTQYFDRKFAAAERIQQDIHEWFIRQEVENDVPVTLVDRGKKITVIIPFLNEGDEVIHTVESVREFAGDRVDILVINDSSTDGYDYRGKLASSDVYYVFNRKRKGVAASRDYGIGLCVTPYFLLLDAHMRFYEGRWVDRIVSLLDADDRCLLCAQTRFLRKNEEGVIYAENDTVLTFGAYQPFMKDSYIPDITWKYKEDCPGEPLEPIPAVLGAGYAASRRYWKYLRGLEGLLLYGSDEAYISFKVWLEGGRCLLLKDVVIAHIYRTEAPYRMYDEKLVYNYLFISRLLFSPSFRCLSFAIAHAKNREVYLRACRLLETNKEQVDELSAYYKRIFTVPFRDVIGRHRFLQPDQEVEICKYAKSRLPELAAFLLKHRATSDMGVCKGKAGLFLWFLHYAEFTGLQEWYDVAASLAEDLKADWDKNTSYDFYSGITGIGWAFVYAYLQGLYHENPETVLREMDKTLMTIDWEAKDVTNECCKGVGSLLGYLTVRLRMIGRDSSASPYTPDFMETVRRLCREILERSGDMYTLYFAYLFLETDRNGIDPEDLLPAFHDWMDLAVFLPKAEKHRTPYLNGGSAGYGMLLMLAYKNRTKK